MSVNEKIIRDKSNRKGVEQTRYLYTNRLVISAPRHESGRTGTSATDFTPPTLCELGNFKTEKIVCAIFNG